MAYLITENCTGCGACAGRCPTAAIAGRTGALHRVDPARCIDCGACGDVCFDEAVIDRDGHVCVAIDPALRLVARVDALSCTGCAVCVWTCPFGALRMAPHPAGVPVAEVIPARCVGCGLCAIDCPHGAVHGVQRAAARIQEAA